MRNLYPLFLLLGIGFLYGDMRHDLPEPYNTVDVLPFDGQGWYMNGSQMRELIKKKNVKIVIEVGSWLGASTRHIASVLPKGGKVYAVDHWKGSVEHQEGQDAWSPHLPHLYEQFLSNVIHAKLTNKIIPVKMDSLEAAWHLRHIVPDLIYIDAGHETDDVYADLNAWYPFVQGRGILCGDDWTWQSVRLAVEIFARERNLKINASGNFWRLK